MGLTPAPAPALAAGPMAAPAYRAAAMLVPVVRRVVAAGRPVTPVTDPVVLLSGVGPVAQGALAGGGFPGAGSDLPVAVPSSMAAPARPVDPVVLLSGVGPGAQGALAGGRFPGAGSDLPVAVPSSMAAPARPVDPVVLLSGAGPGAQGALAAGRFPGAGSGLAVAVSSPMAAPARPVDPAGLVAGVRMDLMDSQGHLLRRGFSGDGRVAMAGARPVAAVGSVPGVPSVPSAAVKDRGLARSRSVAAPAYRAASGPVALMAAVVESAVPVAGPLMAGRGALTAGQLPSAGRLVAGRVASSAGRVPVIRTVPVAPAGAADLVAPAVVAATARPVDPAVAVAGAGLAVAVSPLAAPAGPVDPVAGPRVERQVFLAAGRVPVVRVLSAVPVRDLAARRVAVSPAGGAGLVATVVAAPLVAAPADPVAGVWVAGRASPAVGEVRPGAGPMAGEGPVVPVGSVGGPSVPSAAVKDRVFARSRAVRVQDRVALTASAFAAVPPAGVRPMTQGFLTAGGLPVAGSDLAVAAPSVAGEGSRVATAAVVLALWAVPGGPGARGGSGGVGVAWGSLGCGVRSAVDWRGGAGVPGRSGVPGGLGGVGGSGVVPGPVAADPVGGADSAGVPGSPGGFRASAGGGAGVGVRCSGVRVRGFWRVE